MALVTTLVNVRVSMLALVTKDLLTDVVMLGPVMLPSVSVLSSVALLRVEVQVADVLLKARSILGALDPQVVTLTAAILFDPSALVCVVFVAAAWALFLKKNADPDWAPVVGGIALGPTQRWLILACGTALLLFLVAGTVIIHAALLYAAAALVHGVLHDPSDCHETILGGRHPRLMVPL
ncbi:unnamed protein product [Prorocentrum cordatum]|uniref:PRA1 family protein n=1 Tax=Prorocentrum cordatum TaxID=2364126 RepID=A0ABN9YIE2_9DINO|nr:unnamed protein product [Polarella glacialis]